MTSYQKNSEIDNQKPLLIVLEGVDKVGKSTIYQQLRRVTHYQPLVIDRFIGSNIVYDRVYGRPSNIPAYYETERKLKEIFTLVVVYLTCGERELLTRMELKETGENLEKAVANHKRASAQYDKYLQNTKADLVIKLDTTNISVDEAVSKILESIRRIGYEG